MFEALIFWTLLAVVVGVVAEKRGRSGVGWFLISLFISPVLSLLILIAMQPAGVAAASEIVDPKTLTRCTQCRELIRKDALKCKHCGSDHAPEPQVETAPVSRPGKYLLNEQEKKIEYAIISVAVAAVLIIGFVGLKMAGST